MKKHRTFLGIVLFIKLKSIKTNAIKLLMWDILGYAKNVGIFLGRKILKLGFFWVLKI